MIIRRNASSRKKTIKRDSSGQVLIRRGAKIPLQSQRKRDMKGGSARDRRKSPYSGGIIRWETDPASA